MSRAGATAPLVSARGLTVSYEAGAEPVLRSIDLQVGPGERLFLLGPSGSGKSTLALTLAGVIPRAVGAEVRGELTVMGHALPSEEPHVPGVGIVFQDPDSQICTLTVEDEVAFGLENLGFPRERIGPAIDSVLERVGLSTERKTRVDRLSGGMKQRLALAAVLAMEPGLLILDEPTAHLDPAGARALVDAVREICAQDSRMGLILIEHRLEPWLETINRVFVLGSDGGVVLDGSPESVFASETGRRQLDALGVWHPLSGRLLPGPRGAAEASAEPAVELRDVRFSYRRDRSTIRGITASFHEGETVALLGENGSGKTTLALLTAGLLEPQNGEVLLWSRAPHRLSARELSSLCGYVFQNPEHQFITDSVYQELAFELERGDVDPQEIRRRTEARLEELGLSHRAVASPFDLSEGQKRRLSVATALTVPKRLLILDEPTVGQDLANMRSQIAWIRSLRESGLTVMIVTHDMELVWETADRVAILHRGELLALGPTEEVMRDGELLSAAGLEAPPALRTGANVGANVGAGSKAKS